MNDEPKRKGGRPAGENIDYRAMWLEAERDLDELRRSIVSVERTIKVDVTDLGKDSAWNLASDARKTARAQVIEYVAVNFLHYEIASLPSSGAGSGEVRCRMAVCTLPKLAHADMTHRRHVRQRLGAIKDLDALGGLKATLDR